MQQDTQTVMHFFHLFLQVKSHKVRCLALNQALNATLNAFLPRHYRTGNHHDHCRNPQRQWKITPRASLQQSEDQRAQDDEWISALLSEINIYKLLWVIKFSPNRLHCESTSISQWLQIPLTGTKPQLERVHLHSSHSSKGSRRKSNSLSIHSLHNLDLNLLFIQGA